MLRHVTQRAIAGIAVVGGVVTLTFLLLHAGPGDPADRRLGPTAAAEQLAAQRRALGLERSLPTQYASWLARAARGDWGISIATGRPVVAMFAGAWPATVRLVLLSLVLAYGLGVAVGAVQATHDGSRLDTALSITSVALFALPGYWLGLMLVMVFTYWLRVLPAFGSAGFDSDFLTGWPRVADRLRHLALPPLTLTLIGVGGTARFVRGAMLGVRAPPFVTAARAKGLKPPPLSCPRATPTPSATSSPRGSCHRSPATGTASSTRWARTASAATSGPGWCTAPASRSASGSLPSCSRSPSARRSAPSRPTGAGPSARCCWPSPTSLSPCPASSCCCCSPRCGVPAPRSSSSCSASPDGCRWPAWCTGRSARSPPGRSPRAPWRSGPGAAA